MSGGSIPLMILPSAATHVGGAARIARNGQIKIKLTNLSLVCTITGTYASYE